MMNLNELLKGIIDISAEADLISMEAVRVSGIALDSRKVAVGDLFIALSGAKQHGLSHAVKAVEQGAVAVLYEPGGHEKEIQDWAANVPLIRVEGLGVLVGELAARLYDFPSQKLKVIGITGTNGKTSCSQYLGQALTGCGIIGTLGWGDWGSLRQTQNTTPDAVSVQQMLGAFVDEKKAYAAMEVSSHGLDQGRVNGVQFEGAVYTNISRDHLDYHLTMDAYVKAKLKLLQAPGLDFVVVNLDDSFCGAVLAAVPKSVKIWGFSTQGKVNQSLQSVMAEGIQQTTHGIEFTVKWRDEKQSIQAPLFGNYNAENLLCVITVMLAIGYSLSEIAAKMARIQPVAGRMERCGTEAKDIEVFVDYAHTPDALSKVLADLRKFCSQSLWVVFGCGGNRDSGKRPEMGGIAENWADFVIVTDDNPRFEDSQMIAKEIISGCSTDKVVFIPDRKQAISHAILNAKKNDCIVIAGKGHETYQEVRGTQYPFNDKVIAEEFMQRRVELS